MFADRLKELRNEKNITQVQLAELLGVSNGTVAMWETGKREPNYEMLNKLSEIFDKNIGYIIGYSNDASSVKMREKEAEQLGAWAAEDDFYETIMKYLALDEYGKASVEDLIKNEMTRCCEQDSVMSTDNISLSIRVRVE